MSGGRSARWCVPTYATGTRRHGRDAWMRSMEASLARIFRLPAPAPESAVLGAAWYGPYSAPFAQSVRMWSSSRMWPRSEPGAAPKSLPPWWRSDTPGPMESLRRLRWALRTGGCDGGSLLPTLTAGGNYNVKRRGCSGDGLATAVKRLPTLVATDSSRGGAPRAGHGPTLREVSGGPLNPLWIEWYMGLPEGWTGSMRWGTSRCHYRQLPLI